jgi:cell division protein FtsW
MGKKGSDKIFLLIICLLVSAGLLVFLSSSMSLAARDSFNVYRAIVMQLVGLGLGIIGGLVLAFWAKALPILKKMAPWIFGLALVLMGLVFTKLGLSINGARRWLDIAGLSFQPAEILKPAVIIFLAFYLSIKRDQLGEWKYGFLPFCVIIGLPILFLGLQPDMDGAATIAICGLIMYFVAGAKWRDILIIITCGILALGVLIVWKPYIKDRFTTFLNPEANSQGISYQLQQSLIAIGSGGVTGKGFGQSLQKFKYLPESTSDSIFSVASEEFGLVGATAIVFLFLAFALRGLRLASKSMDGFGGLITVGIVILIMCQAYVNIGSMIGILPLSGLPLIFFSKGGSSLMLALWEIGLIINVSRFTKNCRTNE